MLCPHGPPIVEAVTSDMPGTSHRRRDLSWMLVIAYDRHLVVLRYSCAGVALADVTELQPRTDFNRLCWLLVLTSDHLVEDVEIKQQTQVDGPKARLEPHLNEDLPSYTATGASAETTPAAGMTDCKWKNIIYAKEALYRAATEPMDKDIHIKIQSNTNSYLTLVWITNPLSEWSTWLLRDNVEYKFVTVPLPPNGKFPYIL